MKVFLKYLIFKKAIKDFYIRNQDNCKKNLSFFAVPEEFLEYLEQNEKIFKDLKLLEITINKRHSNQKISEFNRIIRIIGTKFLKKDGISYIYNTFVNDKTK